MYVKFLLSPSIYDKKVKIVHSFILLYSYFCDSFESLCQVSFLRNFSTDRPPVYLKHSSMSYNTNYRSLTDLATRLVGSTWLGPEALSPWVTVEPSPRNRDP